MTTYYRNIPLEFWFNRDPGSALPIVYMPHRLVTQNDKAAIIQRWWKTILCHKEYIEKKRASIIIQRWWRPICWIPDSNLVKKLSIQFEEKQTTRQF
jgi:hypothetical protein